MKTRTVLLLAALCAFLTSCMSMNTRNSSGTPIDPGKVAQIVKGKTTRAEVEALLGKPENTMLVADGKRMMAYAHSEMNMKAGFTGVKGTTRTQTLQIYLTKEGIVEDYEFNDNARDVRGNMLGGNVESTPRTP